MHKEAVTGRTIIDDDFLKIELKPPKKMKVTDASKETMKLWREIDRLLYGLNKKKYKKKEFTSRGFSGRKQLCTVKMYYGNTKESHKEFLRRYMPQENKKEVEDKPTLFNERYDIVPESELLRYESQMDDFHFKFMISPESQTVPSKEIVRSFIKQLEDSTGFKFDWMAVEHTNTDHKHCHILINGVDKKNKRKIKFPKIIIKETARNLACNICTSLIGYRTKEQIESSRARLPFAYRWTKIDDELLKNTYKSFSSIKNIDDTDYEAQKIARNEIESNRLDHLCQMGLAKKYSGHIPPVYYLEKDWQKKLKAMGRYNSFLDARNKMTFVNPCKLEQYTSETGQVMGIITQRYVMDDEGVWKNAIVIENKREDKAWFVPLFYQPAPELEGATVSLNLIKNQKGLLVPKITILDNSLRKR